MRVVVTGATGLLGRDVLATFAKEDDLEVTAWGWTRADRERVLKVDVTDAAAVGAALREARPDVVVHCAAERRPDHCTEASGDAVLALNVEAARSIAAAAEGLGAYTVYISTDYVFDGTAPPYRPQDAPNPLNFYGKTKALGETAVLEASPAAAVLRVPVLHGRVETLKESSMTSVAAMVLANSEGAWLDNHQIRYPTYTSDIALALAEMARKRPPGIFHFSNKEAFTKWGVATLLAEALALPMDKITRRDEPATGGAPRPHNAQLDMGALEALGIGLRHTTVRDSLLASVRPLLPAAATASE